MHANLKLQEEKLFFYFEENSFKIILSTSILIEFERERERERERDPYLDQDSQVLNAQLFTLYTLERQEHVMSHGPCEIYF